MKQLILIGGHPGKAHDENALAHAMQTQGADELKVAFCNFARTETEWDESDSNSADMFKRFGGSKILAFKTMSPVNFVEISEWADVIYMPGGDPGALKTALDKFPDLSELWDGKIIAGSSAGADVLCAHYVYLQEKSFSEGYGWVQTTMIPHWGNYDGFADNDWADLREAAIQRRPDLPVLCNPEGEFVEFAVQ